MTTTSQRQPITDYPVQDRPLTLRCPACKKVAKYKIGRLVVDPDYARDPNVHSPNTLIRDLTKIDWANWISFSGFFVCKGCGSGGPWEVPPAGKREIAFLLIRHYFQPDNSGIFIGRTTLFDGTYARSGYHSVEHLKKLLAADPNNGYLWNRLGNTFIAAEEPTMAEPAYLKAIEFDPLDMESLHSLGVIFFDEGNYETAATYFHRMLMDCRMGTWHNKSILEPLLLDAVDRMAQISLDTNQKIPFMPVQQPTPDAQDRERNPTLELRTFDLSEESDRHRMVQMLMRRPTPTQQSLHKDWQAKPLPPAFTKNREGPNRLASNRVGRNDLCPCGSGKKYKKCCYR